MKIRFSKYQGAGNDFVLIDNRKQKLKLEIDQIQRLCHRNYGIGSDGLILLEESQSADFDMQFFNPDGSSGMMCGNGGRCIVAFAADLLMPLDIVFQVLLGGNQIIALEDDDTVRRADIRINGGYGYNYAIVPLLEALGATGLKTQAEYEATIATEGTLGYILKTVLHTVNDNLDTPLDFVLGLFANLAYTVSKDGATTFVSNLIAPLSEVIKAIEGVLPVAIKVNLMALMDGGSVAEILLGEDVVDHAFLVSLLADGALDGNGDDGAVADIDDEKDDHRGDYGGGQVGIFTQKE